MHDTRYVRGLGRGAIFVMALLAWPAVSLAQLSINPTSVLGGATSSAQSLTGQASAVRASVLGVTTTLADTGSLGGAGDARDNSALSGAIPALLGGEVLSAATIGWPDQVVSGASLAGLT